MKKVKHCLETEKSLFYKCPHCGARIRRHKDTKILNPNYRQSRECFSCKERFIVVGPNTGASRYSKIICPYCKKNKILATSKSCRECYMKDRRKIMSNNGKKIMKGGFINYEI